MRYLFYMNRRDRNPRNLPYRPCVGIALLNEENKVFVGERIDTPGAWQMPQGGVDRGEDIEAAFFREMCEEIGTEQADILKVLETPLRYDLPSRLYGKLWNGKYGGHKPAEFRAWQWAGLDEVLDLIVPFKRDTYQKVITFIEDSVF